MWQKWAVLVSLMTFRVVANSTEASVGSRQDKALNVFNVVRFPNDVCNTTSGKSGTCYSASECSAFGGSSLGTCASGFGVCCGLTASCGATTSVNNTYFKSSTSDTSPCQIFVCKITNNICQIRLDFDTFDIDQPVSQDVSSATTSKTQCNSAQFSATTDGGTAPVICGTNTGYHMILEAKDACNSLTFSWTSTSSKRSWDMKISQIPCDVSWKPPAGCLQHFTGTTGTVYSYNYLGGVHLANQQYTNCIRTEEGYCSIAYSSSKFEVSDVVNEGKIGGECVTDYVIIPRAGGSTLQEGINYDRFCGGLLTYTVPKTTTRTLYTVRYPFQIGVYFDGTETTTTPVAEKSFGFAISYKQFASCSLP
ncbi:uncharacterized protein LOC111703824 [Eurytemora carolleeae]|uniref:uncharacterized protein LOC111703824 n=1 Tax=Eurytemora carolleeae TaxID=1294199 RepID=UPI000C795253|nr:uncharacterized protein LOC111703824 [Eurytemora carolleeae]|eukprot:XP_023331656.1 uncharacterized protein LOC111703824 [Eurytemora affinis]